MRFPDERRLAGADGDTMRPFIVIRFLVEDELIGLALPSLSKVKNWGVHTVKDGRLITGQNPASSGPTAKLLTETLKAQ